MREGWKRYKIEELGRIITGKTPSTQNPKNFGTVSVNKVLDQAALLADFWTKDE